LTLGIASLLLSFIAYVPFIPFLSLMSFPLGLCAMVTGWVGRRQAAADSFTEMLKVTQRRGLPTYLSVFKRHRPDSFLLSHAVDGYSMAMDFKVTDGNRRALQALCDDLARIALEAHGRFYFAKDSTLRAPDAAAFLGDEAIRRFRELKWNISFKNVNGRV